MSGDDEFREFASLLVDEVIARAQVQLNAGEPLCLDDQKHMLGQLITERKRLAKARGDA